MRKKRVMKFSLSPEEIAVIKEFELAVNKMKREFETADDFHSYLRYIGKGNQYVSRGNVKVLISKLLACERTMPNGFYEKIQGLGNSYPYMLTPAKRMQLLLEEKIKDFTKNELVLILRQKIGPDFEAHPLTDNLSIDVAEFYENTPRNIIELVGFNYALAINLIALLYIQKESSETFSLILDQWEESYFENDDLEEELFEDDNDEEEFSELSSIDDELEELRSEFDVETKSLAKEYSKEAITKLTNLLDGIKVLEAYLVGRAGPEILSLYRYHSRNEIICKKSFVDELAKIILKNSDAAKLFLNCLDADLPYSWNIYVSQFSERRCAKIYHYEEKPLVIYFN